MMDSFGNELARAASAQRATGTRSAQAGALIGASIDHSYRRETCLRLALELSRQSGAHDARSVVSDAATFFAFIGGADQEAIND